MDVDGQTDWYVWVGRGIGPIKIDKLEVGLKINIIVHVSLMRRAGEMSINEFRSKTARAIQIIAAYTSEFKDVK